MHHNNPMRSPLTARPAPAALLTPFLIFGLLTLADRQLAGQSSSGNRQPSDQQRDYLITKGRVHHIYAPRLFTIVDTSNDDRQLLVMMPHAEAIPLVNTTIIASGPLRTFDEVAQEVAALGGIDESAMEKFRGNPILLAESVMTATGTQLVGIGARTPTAVRTRQSARVQRIVPGATADTTIKTIRPSALVHLIDELAGQTVTVQNARVVGVFNPSVFLIESATAFPAMLGTRDRIVVLIGNGARLRVAPDAIVGSRVKVAGVVRTLLGIQVTGEVAWPPELTRELVERLEIRAAVLAGTIQTADGVELTDRRGPG